jgi:hypothetical protein
VAFYAGALAMAWSIALSVWGVRRHSAPALFLASALALAFLIPEAPVVGFFALALPAAQFGLALWRVVRLPAPARALVCAAAAVLFVAEVPQLLAQML